MTRICPSVEIQRAERGHWLAKTLSGSQQLREPECQVDRLSGIQAGITRRRVALAELRFGDVSVTSETLGDVVTRELDVNPTRPGTHLAMGLEEAS